MEIRERIFRKVLTKYKIYIKYNKDGLSNLIGKTGLDPRMQVRILSQAQNLKGGNHV